jgi:hypothetical protein
MISLLKAQEAYFTDKLLNAHFAYTQATYFKPADCAIGNHSSTIQSQASIHLIKLHCCFNLYYIDTLRANAQDFKTSISYRIALM